MIRLPLLGTLLLATGLVLGCSAISTNSHAQGDQPATFEGVLLNPDHITAVRDALRNGTATAEQEAALQTLIALADDAMSLPVGAVTDKPKAGPSGDKHDYVSLSPYWWPNPDTADGLPYIRKDGQFNPERDNYDVAPLSDMADAVRWLGFAYYFTGNEAYAKNAVERCRVWFVDPETRMTPRVQYGQFIPGVEDEGRHLGIIETVRLRWFPDSFNMLAGSEHMTDDVRDGVKQWFDDFAQWLMDSDFGTAERVYPNNHGTWANAQTATYARFAGRDDIADEVLATIPGRIAAQIEPDGSQPHELERTNALHYSDFNLRAHMDLATLGDAYGVDLWNFKTDDGRSLRAAADFVRPYYANEKPWPHQQINPRKGVHMATAMRVAAQGFDDPRYEAVIPELMKLEKFTDEGHVWLELIMPEAQE